MQRMLGLTLGVFILCCLLSPFLLQAPGLRLELAEDPGQEALERSARLTETVEAQRNAAAAAGIQKLALAILEEMGINSHTAAINISVAQGDITAELTLDAALSGRRGAIEQELSEKLGIPVAVLFL
jgi:hypothetical protein